MRRGQPDNVGQLRLADEKRSPHDRPKCSHTRDTRRSSAGRSTGSPLPWLRRMSAAWIVDLSARASRGGHDLPPFECESASVKVAAIGADWAPIVKRPPQLLTWAQDCT